MIDLFSEQISKPYHITENITIYSLIENDPRYQYPILYFGMFVLALILLYDFFDKKYFRRYRSIYAQVEPTKKTGWVESLEQSAKTNDFVLIGISGRKRHGKTTIGNYLENNYGFIQLAFGEKVKKVCQIAFEFDDAQLHGSEKDKETVDHYWGHSPRELFQKVGTELFRNRLPELCENISNDIWIRSIDIKLQKLRAMGYNKFVISDVRFPNEHLYIKKKAGDTWKIINPRLTVDNKSSDNQIPEHSSEALIDTLDCDVNFNNDKSLDDLYKSVDDEMNKN